MKKYKTLEQLNINREALKRDLILLKEGKLKQKYEELDFSRLGPKPKNKKNGR